MFVEAKGYFDNNYRTWDGWKCSKCGEVFDPDELNTYQESHEVEGGIECPRCFHLHPTFDKVRRRCEDALRKTATCQMLAEIAKILGVKID